MGILLLWVLCLLGIISERLFPQAQRVCSVHHSYIFWSAQICYKDILWSSLSTGNRAANLDLPPPPPFFQLLQAGEGHHLLQDPTLSWTLSSVPNFLFSQVPWWVSRSFSLPPQSGVNLLFTRVFDSFFIFPYEACYGAARPIFSHFSLCLSTSRSTI